MKFLFALLYIEINDLRNWKLYQIFNSSQVNKVAKKNSGNDSMKKSHK